MGGGVETVLTRLNALATSGRRSRIAVSKKISNSRKKSLSVLTVRGWRCRRVTILLLSLLLRGPIAPVFFWWVWVPAVIVLPVLFFDSLSCPSFRFSIPNCFPNRLSGPDYVPCSPNARIPRSSCCIHARRTPHAEPSLRRFVRRLRSRRRLPHRSRRFHRLPRPAIRPVPL